MKQWLDSLQLSRTERNGIVVLVLGIMLMMGIRLYLLYFYNPPLPIGDMATFQQEIEAFEADTLLELNTATAEALEQLPGIGPSMAEKIIAYRDELGGFSYAEQLMEIPGIGEAKLDGLLPYISIDTSLAKVIVPKPDNLNPKTEGATQEGEELWPLKLKAGEQIDLNKASIEQLRQLPGIGLAFAERIASYRMRLGGFHSTEQLLEVGGIGETKYQALAEHLTLGAGALTLLNVNTVDGQVLLKHPYAKEAWVAALLQNRPYGSLKEIPKEGLDKRILPYLVVE